MDFVEIFEIINQYKIEKGMEVKERMEGEVKGKIGRKKGEELSLMQRFIMNMARIVKEIDEKVFEGTGEIIKKKRQREKDL